jgi:large-conductance mechanosensitive channel
VAIKIIKICVAFRFVSLYIYIIVKTQNKGTKNEKAKMVQQKSNNETSAQTL